MFLSLIVIIVGYQLGCISVGYYLVRLRTGQDLREIGSGATGGRNASRALGRSGAILTGLGDILKGVLAMSITRHFSIDDWAVGLTMIAVLAGHVWPFQLQFRGGKGLSAAFGAVLAYDFRIALAVAVIALVLFAISKRNEAAFLVGIATAPIAAILLGAPAVIVVAIFALICIILWAHRENFRAGLQSYSMRRDI